MWGGLCGCVCVGVWGCVCRCEGVVWVCGGVGVGGCVGVGVCV